PPFAQSSRPPGPRPLIMTRATARFRPRGTTMRVRALLTLALLALPLYADDSKPPPAPPKRVLPGIKPDGTIHLANQWKLRPAGTQIQLGDFPVQIVAHPDGRHVAVLHSGYREHDVVVVDLKATDPRGAARPQVVSRTALDQSFYGLCFSPDGR